MSITRGALKTSIRNLSDQTYSNFISDDELNDYIQQSHYALYDLLVSRFEDYNISSANKTIATGSTFTVPTDFYKLRGVDYLVDGTNYICLHQFNWNQRNDQNLDPSPQYRLVGSTVYVRPTSQAIGDYVIWYVPTLTALSSDASTIDGVSGWEYYIVLDCCIKIGTKQEQDVAVFLREKEAMIKRIETMAANRDASGNMTIVNVNNMDRFDYRYYGLI